MNLTFHINYHTHWGESLYLTGDLSELGENNPHCGIKMTPSDDQSWTVEIEVPDSLKSFEYGYAVISEEGYVRNEWGRKRLFNMPDNTSCCHIFDHWQDMPADKPFYSSAFTKCINKRQKNKTLPAEASGKTLIRIEAPTVRSDEQLAISGDCSMLGKWNPALAPVMNDAEFPVWSISLDNEGLSNGTDFKFIIVKKQSGEVVEWEDGANRHIAPYGFNPENAVIINGLRFNSAGRQWHGAGVAIPVFSLRSEEDFGVGDFYDLKKMVDWAVATKQSFIQLLPINDTTMTGTWTDSYPYNANSTFALHPMYLRLSEIGRLENPAREDFYEAVRLELNSLPTVDYERVNAIKNEYTRELFADCGARTIESEDFKNFAHRNEDWLMPYAAFCVLRDQNGTSEFEKWGEYSAYDHDSVKTFIENNSNEINFVLFQQYHLDRQMRDVRDYAHSNGVAIKGDIPIGISRTSVDAWISPRLFNMNSQAGAPPDDFSVLGQNWGFPTYNWDEMSLDGFKWWKNRFCKMSEYFDAYRIDHVLGFFRIWQIPMNAIHGLLGTFNPALPFSADELRVSYDFWINPDVQTKPFIMEWFLGDFFGEFTDEARERFLEPCGDGRYLLKTEFDTQRKIADYFKTLDKNDKNDKLCNALMGLVDDVLFIEDQNEKGKYHPRIAAQNTYIYRSLTDYEKWCFNRLYNDFFYRRHNEFWYGKAMWKLPPLIDATDMLTCAEDLGMIPACVPAVMDRLKILALEIQRMPKDPHAEFGNTWHYPYLSVCTTSTHDMGGIRQWWEENREATQHFYNNVLHEHGTAPYYAEPWICGRIVDLHLKSPSMLCILPLQDWLSINGDLRRQNPYDEQINVPANSRHYWRYRMHLTLENLLSQTDFNNHLKSLIPDSNR